MLTDAQLVKIFLHIVKVKLSLYRPVAALRVAERLRLPYFQTSGSQMAARLSAVVNPTRRHLFTPRKIPGTHLF
jgi:hypothetical protein